MKRIDMTGHVFGRLVAIKPSHTKNSKLWWDCVCSCGKTAKVPTENLRSGKTKSCGCMMSEINREKAIKRNFVHGHNTVAKKTPTWTSWVSMLSRCRNPKHRSYKYYGGRGITVCDRWAGSFLFFLEDMGERPAGKTIDRINNDAGYSKENCKWSTGSEQQKNKQCHRKANAQ